MSRPPKSTTVKGFEPAPESEPKTEKRAEPRTEKDKADKPADAYEQRHGANIGGNGQPVEDTNGKKAED